MSSAGASLVVTADDSTGAMEAGARRALRRGGRWRWCPSGHDGLGNATAWWSTCDPATLAADEARRRITGGDR